MNSEKRSSHSSDSLVDRFAAGDVVLRPQSAGDAEFLFTLYKSTRETQLRSTGWLDAEIDGFLAQQFDAQSRAYRAQFPHADFLIIEWQGQPIGRLYLDRKPGETHLIDIALLPGFRGRELGASLIQSVLDQAAQSGYRVTLHVAQDNPARRLYERLGFEYTDEPRGMYLPMRWDGEKH